MLKIINTKKAPIAIGPYNQAIHAGNFIFLSGQIPINPKNNIIKESISDQVTQSLENIKNILKETNLKIKNIVKTTLFIIDFNDFEIINITYEKFFKINKSIFPARSCVQVSKLPKNVKIEIEAIAFRF